MSETYAAEGIPLERRCSMARNFFEEAQIKLQQSLDGHMQFVEEAKKITMRRAAQVSPTAAEVLQQMYATRTETHSEEMEKSYSIMWGFAVDSAKLLYGPDAVEVVLKDFAKTGKAN